jgi:Lon protease-like protein
MFPLGTVVFPHAVLPLHIFEPRYRALTERCLATDSTFGVVLIERGSEVGGGDQRFTVGTLTRIVQAEHLDDGRWVLVTVGESRLRVRRWLADDPYPLADVELLDDPAGIDDTGLVTEVERTLQRVLALRTELGEPGAAIDVTLPPDPVRASYEASVLAALGPMDAQELLETDDAEQRLRVLAARLLEHVAVLEFRLTGG